MYALKSPIPHVMSNTNRQESSSWLASRTQAGVAQNKSYNISLVPGVLFSLKRLGAKFRDVTEWHTAWRHNISHQVESSEREENAWVLGCYNKHDSDETICEKIMRLNILPNQFYAALAIFSAPKRGGRGGGVEPPQIFYLRIRADQPVLANTNTDPFKKPWKKKQISRRWHS